MVIVQSDNKNRSTWLLAIVEETYPGKDNVIRAVRVKTSNKTLERAMQHLHPLELNCDIAQTSQALNPEAAEYHARAARDAATAARMRIEQIVDIEQTS